VLDPFRRILALPGALAFSATGLVARMPIAMLGLGIVLLVSDRTGSYALAGSISAAQVAAGAVASPLQGRLMDRFGQARVLRVAAAGFALGIGSTIAAVERDWVLPLPHLCAVLAGATVPQIGSVVRTRWRHVVRERRQLDTAFALEAVVDEVIFIVGPVLVTFLATSHHPWSGLVAAGALGATGALVFAELRSTQPPVHVRERGTPAVPMPWRRLAPLMVVGVGLGSLFGSAEVVTVAFAEAAGNTSAAGWMLATWAAGSLLAGLIVGARPPRRNALSLLRWSATALTVFMAPLMVLPGVPSVTVLLFFAGFAISPTLIASISLVERVVPAARLTEGIGWVTTGLAGGIAPGAAISGLVIDSLGASTAYAVPALSGMVAVAAAWAVRRPADEPLEPSKDEAAEAA
jgi:MFS family permease